MTRLTEEEKQAFRETTKGAMQQPPPSDEERFVAPTPDARLRYIRFATQAARLHRPPPFRPMRGDHWKL